MRVKFMPGAANRFPRNGNIKQFKAHVLHMVQGAKSLQVLHTVYSGQRYTVWLCAGTVVVQ